MAGDPPPAGAVDLIIRSSKIWPMTSIGASVDGALRMSGGRITAIGPIDEVLRGGPSAQVLDVGSRPVLPGFVDAHAHIEMLSRAIATTIPVYSPPCLSIEDILATFAANLHRAEEFGGWLVGQGSLFQDRKLIDRRLPTRHDLDRVSTSVPMAFRPGGHILVVNTRALELIEQRLPPGSFDGQRGIADARRTGTFRELEISSVPLIPEPVDFDLRASIESAVQDHFLRNGVTTVHDIPSTERGLYVLDELVSTGALPVKLREYVTLPKMIRREDVLGLRDRFPLAAPPGRMAIAGVKIFIDGGVSSSLAAVLTPYAGTADARGQLYFDEAEVASLVRECATADLQLIAHTMGERAQHLLCDAAHGITTPQPVRSEHGGVIMTEPATLDRFLAAGVLPVPNAVFLYTLGDFIPEALGRHAARGRLPLRTMLDRGIELAGSSDATGSELRHANPFFGIWCAVARKSFRGEIIEEQEALTVDEALHMHTAGSAAAGGEIAEKGTLEIGKAADLLVLDRDPRQLAGDALLDVHPDHVFVDGRLAYTRNPTIGA